MVYKEKRADDYTNVSKEIFKSTKMDVSEREVSYVSNVLSFYPNNIAKIFSFWLSNIASKTRNKEEVINAAKKLESQALKDLFSKYSLIPIVSEKLASKFGYYLLTKSKIKADEIDSIAIFFTENEVYNFFVKFSKSNSSKSEVSKFLENLTSDFFEFASLMPNEKVKNFLFSEFKNLENEKTTSSGKFTEKFSKFNKLLKVFSAINTVPKLGQRTLSNLSTLPDFELIFLKLSEIEDKNEIRELAYLLNNSINDYKDILLNWERMKRSLRLDYNLEFLGRYPWNVLKHMNENVDRRIIEKPLAVLIYNKSDHNGAFYYDYELISRLLKYYDIRIIEAGTDRDFETWSLIMSNKYGKADLVVIAGHGSPVDIKLGEGVDPTYSLDLTDEGSFIALSNLLREGGQIILFACSTGDKNTNQSIANIISANVHASSVFAPDKPTGPAEIIIEKENNTKRKKNFQINKYNIYVAAVKYSKGADLAVYEEGKLK